MLLPFWKETKFMSAPLGARENPAAHLHNHRKELRPSDKCSTWRSSNKLDINMYYHVLRIYVLATVVKILLNPWWQGIASLIPKNGWYGNIFLSPSPTHVTLLRQTMVFFQPLPSPFPVPISCTLSLCFHFRLEKLSLQSDNAKVVFISRRFINVHNFGCHTKM